MSDVLLIAAIVLCCLFLLYQFLTKELGDSEQKEEWGWPW